MASQKKLGYTPNTGSRYFTDFESTETNDTGAQQGPISQRLLGSDTPAEPTQQEQYAASLANTRAEFERIQADTQKARDDSFTQAQAKMDESRKAYEDQKANQRTLGDNTARDLSNSGEAIIVDGGSANSADAAEGDDQLKKKRPGGAISNQLGINV